MTQNEPKKKRIEQILTAAASEFLDKGYEGASVDSIARRAGLTKGGVYHHFSNKDAILHAANDLFQQPIEQLAEKCRAMPSAMAGLRRFIRGYLIHWASHAHEIAFVFLSLSKVLLVEESWSIIRRYYEQGIEDYRQQLNRAVAQGELAEHDTEAKALTLMAALDGVTPLLVTMGRSLDVAAIAEQFETALLGELRVEMAQQDEV